MESQVFTNAQTRNRRALLTDPQDLKLDTNLRAHVASMQAMAPMDPQNGGRIADSFIAHHIKKALRLPRLKAITKPTKKGGFTFTSMKNLLVDPHSALRV